MFKAKRITALLLAAVIIIGEDNLYTLPLQAQGVTSTSEAGVNVESEGEDTEDLAGIPEETNSGESDAEEDLAEISAEREQTKTNPDETEQLVSEEDLTREVEREIEADQKAEELTKPEKNLRTAETELIEEQAETYAEHKAAFAALLADNPVYANLYDCEYADVKAMPKENATMVTRIRAGQQLQLKDVEIIEDQVWYQVEVAVNGIPFTGYLKNKYVITDDIRFNEWKTQYGIDDIHPEDELGTIGAGNTDLSAFPSSYRSYIQKLVEAHPNWTFIPMNTGLDWDTVIVNEMVPQRNLVPSYSMNTWKSTADFAYNSSTGEWYEFSGGGWVQASESIVKYYMDPRNFLNETSVFQFELLTYNGSYHKESGVEAVLKNTFMSKKKLEDGSGSGATYAKAFMQIGKQLNVSPYFLASRVRQEQGTSGTSNLISGNYPGYAGLYNYFNIQATGKTQAEVIINGLKEALKAGWTTRYKALSGGAEKAANNYIRRGQDTLYQQKFDVDSSYDGLYWHQYMQNLLAADSEGKNVRNAYSDMGVLNNSFVFKIPVYNNMPSGAAKKPAETLAKPSLKASVGNLTKVTLKWGEVAGASGYYIYCSDKADSGYKKIKTIKSMGTTSFSQTITPNQTYYYKVRAYMDVYGGPVYSSYSAVASISSKVEKPGWGSVKKSAYTKIKVAWKKVSGVAGYQVYRKTGKNGTYSRIKTIKSADTLSYTDATAMPNQTCYYKVRAYMAVSGKNYYSGYNKEKSVNTKMTKPVIASALFSGKNSLVLKWSADKWVTGYRIYRADTAKGKYQSVKTINGKNNITYTDTGLTANKTYYYKIRSYVTVSGSKKYSAWSDAFTGKTKLNAPKITSATPSSGKNVKLKWKETISATGYEIYRAALQNGSYKLVKTIKKNTTLSYTDKNLKPRKTYYYKVRAYSTVNKKTRYSGYSAVKSAVL